MASRTQGVLDGHQAKTRAVIVRYYAECSISYCRVQNKKFEMICHFLILHEFDWPCAQSERSTLKFLIGHFREMVGN